MVLMMKKQTIFLIAVVLGALQVYTLQNSMDMPLPLVMGVGSALYLILITSITNVVIKKSGQKKRKRITSSSVRCEGTAGMGMKSGWIFLTQGNLVFTFSKRAEDAVVMPLKSIVLVRNTFNRLTIDSAMGNYTIVVAQPAVWKREIGRAVQEAKENDITEELLPAEISQTPVFASQKIYWIALVVLIVSIVILAIASANHSSSSSRKKGYYDDKGKYHSTETERDAWNDAYDWMDKNW